MIEKIQNDLLTPMNRTEVNGYLQQLSTEDIANLSSSEFKECIHNVTRILLIGQDSFGNTIEELAFKIKLKYNNIYKFRSEQYILKEIKNTFKNTPYLIETHILIFGKVNKRYAYRPLSFMV